MFDPSRSLAVTRVEHHPGDRSNNVVDTLGTLEIPGVTVPGEDPLVDLPVERLVETSEPDDLILLY